MGLGFVLLIWLIIAALAAALGLIWLASLALLIFGWARGSRLWCWLGGVPLALSSLVGLACGLVVASGVLWLVYQVIREIAFG